MRILISQNLKDNKKIIKEILKFFPKFRLFLLSGSLGSGKTTLIKQIAKYFKIKETLKSPTFILWQKYKFKYRQKDYFFNHLDLYRIKAQDILKLNLKKEIEKNNNIFFVEWGEKLKNYLRKKRKKYLQIIIRKKKQRRIFLIK